MSILVVGLSHRSSPVDLLERVVPAPETLDKFLADTIGCPHVAAAVVLSTCNRVEIYAEVERFHGGVEELAELLARRSGVPASELTPHLYVRYEDGAVSHLFSVVCGLDSMVVGETQILGQVKAALRNAQDAETVGSVLNGVFQHALRVGKRAHTETDLGRAGRSVVGAALDLASGVLGDLAGRNALVVGAGSMAALAATTLRRERNAPVVVANRTMARARRLAGNVDGRAVSMAELPAELAAVDLVVSCTGAVGTVVSAELLRTVASARGGRPLVVCDLAMPRDVEPAAADLPGVTLVDLAALAAALDQTATRRRRCGPHHRGDGGGRVRREPPGDDGGTDRGGAAQHGGGCRRRRAAPAGRARTRPRRAGPGRGREDRTPGRRQASARAHDPGEGARRADRRDFVRRRAP